MSETHILDRHKCAKLTLLLLSEHKQHKLARYPRQDELFMCATVYSGQKCLCMFVLLRTAIPILEKKKKHIQR